MCVRVRACPCLVLAFPVCIRSSCTRMQELDEPMKRKRYERPELNFRKMRWPCKSCMLSDDPSMNNNFTKPFSEFGVRRASDFTTKLLPQGAWARCISCQEVHRRRFRLILRPFIPSFTPLFVRQTHVGIAFTLFPKGRGLYSHENSVSLANLFAYSGGLLM